MDEFQRCLNFIEGLENRNEGRVERFAFGRAFIDTELSVVWDINFLRVEKAGASWEQLAEAAERLQGGAGLGHRKLILADADGTEDLCNEARRSGWEVTPLTFMVRRRAGARRVPPGIAIRELGYAEMRTMREEMASRQPWATSEDDVRQVLEANRRWAARVHARYFAAEVDGALAAGCDLYRADGIAQIEDVETKEEYRGRGLATAVVTAAAEAALEDQEDPLLFLVADENDWPKVLYEKMGFESVGRRFQLLKTNL